MPPSSPSSARPVRVARPRTGNIWLDVPLFLFSVFVVFFWPLTLFVLVWYTAGVLLPAALGALLGPLLLRW